MIVADQDPARWSAATEVGGRAGGIRVVRPAGRAPAAVPAVGLDSGAIAVIAYTSGTTGTAKGVAHSHEAMLTQVEMVGEHYSATPADEILTLLPLYLLSIFVGPMLAVSVGASCRTLARYDARAVVRSIEKDRTTIAAAVPLFFHDLRELASGNDTDHDLSSLRVISSGGAPLDESLADLIVSGPATDLLLALLRRRPVEDTGISMRGDTALWRSWLALTPL